MVSHEQQQLHGHCTLQGLGGEFCDTCGTCRPGLVLLGPSKPAALASGLLAIRDADMDGIVQIPRVSKC